MSGIGDLGLRLSPYLDLRSSIMLRTGDGRETVYGIIWSGDAKNIAHWGLLHVGLGCGFT